ncbi:hypothetical protein [Brevundimonas nasdae]|uniref:Uncharacterized protein n=1 Tax=Brevundimonas nasdae TaxID=172043 RepID=A0ACD4VTN8_9CAUL|nr:hypothetical protein [Brevundimonas nasdae]WOB79920.1 hypothetical protein PZA08_07030 [Brevundimonas nasdae]
MTRSLHEALIALGADDTLRTAQAIRDQHAPDYDMPSGAMLGLLSEFALAGRVEAFAHAYRLFTVIHPMNGTFVAARTPAMIGAYLNAEHGVTDERWFRWLARNPDWSVQVRDALGDPARFEAFVAATTASIGDGEARAA